MIPGHSTIKNTITAILVYSTFACLGMEATGETGNHIVVRVDRTTRDWSDLAMGPPSASDDADRGQNPRTEFRFVSGYGKPHTDAGSSGNTLPRLNNGRFPTSSDDPANNTWFDTKGNSRIVVDLGRSIALARINVYSWHSGALSPQRYSLWGSNSGTTPDNGTTDLSRSWNEIAIVDTRSLGDGGKHGSSINSGDGAIGQYRYLLFEFPANRPDWNRSGFISEIDIFGQGRALAEIVVKNRRAGVQTLKFGNILHSKPLKNDTPFLIAGPKLYEYGAMDGSFPPVGRQNGEQGGVWCHPIKLLDAFEIEVLEDGQPSWKLVDPSQFEHGFATATFHFDHNGLEAIRQDFVPEKEAALVSSLTLRNVTNEPRKVTVRFRGSVDIRPSYESRLPNGPDIIEYRDRLITALDSEMAGKWGMVFGADRSPASHRVEDNDGVLTYPLNLPVNGSVTLRFVIVGEHLTGIDGARSRFESIIEHVPKLLADKENLYREQILEGVKFSSSDSTMNDAFYSAKANVMMSVMDLRPGYPAPFLAAGFPIYTWLFGCDSLYSTAGVTAGGFKTASRHTLECLLHFASLNKFGAHEVASNGRLLGWDHVQETPQLVLAIWNHYQWTGDRSFLEQAYPVCREIIAHALANADKDHDGYLEGAGLMEQSGMGPERISSVCYLYAAYEGLANMAEALNDTGAAENRRRATELQRSFNRDWWNSKEQMWACSLREDGSLTMDNFWAVVLPQQVGIADRDKALVALDRIENEWVNNEWGFVAQWKSKVTGDGVGIVHNNVLAQTAFAYGKPDLGWKLMKLSAKAPLEERMLGAFDETTPGGGDLMQLWSFGPFLENVVVGLAGIHPQAGPHHIDLFPQLPSGLDWFKLVDCDVGDHKIALEHRRTDEGVTTTVEHVEGGAPIFGTFWSSGGTTKIVTLNGRTITLTNRRTALSSIELPSLNYEIRPGQTLVITRTEDLTAPETFPETNQRPKFTKQPKGAMSP